MGSLRSMLVDEFISEFDELNNFFVKEFLSNNAGSMDLDYFSDYTLEKINNLFGRRKQIFKNDSELLNALRLVINDGYCTALINKRRSLFYIPIFSYLLRHNPVDNLEFQEFCMKVHLTKNKKSLFSLDGLKKLDVPFRARIADTLEMVLLADDFSTDLRTVLNLLDYIDYERFINGERDSEYFKYLENAEKELFSYFSFLASNELLDEYYKNREGNERDYKYGGIRFNKDSLKLMSCFIDTDVKECKNKFLEFKLLEERLKNGSSDENRKNNMLVAFTYRVYPSNDFYDCFSDLDLSMDDLFSFIKRYEETGNILSPRQLDNLFTSFRNRYLDVNGLNDEFNYLFNTVLNEYNRYRKYNFAFLPNEFIRKFNNKCNLDFKSFNYGVSTVLTRDIYEMIINGNNIIRFPEVYSTKSGKKYISSKNMKNSTIVSDGDEYKRKYRIYEKYYPLLDDAMFDSKFTIEYIIRKNVDPIDMDSFMELKNWFDMYSGEKWDHSFRVLERTFRQLQIDFDEELRSSPFNKRLEILYKYNGYAVSDGLEELMTPRFFYKQLHQYEQEFIKNNGIEMFETILLAYNNGDELLPVLGKLGLNVDDINLVFGTMGDDFSIKSAAFQRKASMEASVLGREKKNERREIVDGERRDLLHAFFSDTEAYSLGEFCENKGISLSKMNAAISLTKNDSKLSEAYDAKMSEFKAGRNGSGGARVKDIYDSFLNGIVRSDGSVRPFNYLDYKLMTDMPIRQFGKVVIGEFGEDLALKDFVRRHQDLVKYNEDCLLKEKYVIVVDGVSHEVTEEEKQAAFSFIQEHNLPKEAKLYGLVIRGALNGDLFFDEKGMEQPKMFIKRDK